MPEATPNEARPRNPEIPPGTLISATSMQLKNPNSPAARKEFSIQVGKVMRQIGLSPGVVSRSLIYSEWPQDPTYYTVTFWDSPERMELFRDNSDHAEAMKLAPMLAESVLSATWVGDEIPSKEEVKRRLEEAKSAHLSQETQSES